MCTCESRFSCAGYLLPQSSINKIIKTCDKEKEDTTRDRNSEPLLNKKFRQINFPHWCKLLYTCTNVRLGDTRFVYNNLQICANLCLLTRSVDFYFTLTVNTVTRGIQ